MSAIGYIQARAYESIAQFPLKDVAVVITRQDGTALAMRLTDRNGLIRTVEISVPDRAESQEPNPDEQPYALVNLYAKKKGYEQIESTGIQVFAGTTTYQDLEMVPLGEAPDQLDDTIYYQTPSQGL